MSNFGKGCAALFPGQGSQYVGMGKELFQNFKVAKETFEEASDFSKVGIKQLCFDGPDSELTLTENTQPCLLAVSVAAFRVAQTEVGFTPEIVAGHSLGEYSALVSAGALQIGQAAWLVRERGLAMQKAVPAGVGTMAAILGLDDSTVELLCKVATEEAKKITPTIPETDSKNIIEHIVEPANFNSPGQIVIAGTVEAVKLTASLLKTDSRFSGGKAIPLSVSAPFHCQLMKPARDRMASLFQETQNAQFSKIQINAPQIPYIPNRTARISRESAIISDLLVEQVDHPVLWKQSMETLLAQPQISKIIEFGPGKVLQGLLKKIGANVGKTIQMSGVADLETFKKEFQV